MARARGSQAGGSLLIAGLILTAALLGSGCSISPTLQSAAAPSYLGAADARAERAAEPAALEPKVSSGKVLSAIVFERVTGVPVDPASLLDR